MVNGVVYVSHNGALEPLGRSQVLPYLRGLVRHGIRISLVTFEKPRDLAQRDRADEMRRSLEAAGIAWHPLRYRASLAGKVVNLLQGAWTAARLARRLPAGLFHARSHMAGAMALMARFVRGGRLLFDLRGELAEEYADAGRWRRGGALYRATAALERRLLRRCDGLVVLSERLARRVPARPGREVEVIPCCVDRTLFVPSGAGVPEAIRHVAGAPLLVYSGSVGTWYLLDEMTRFFARARRRIPSLHLLMLCPDPREHPRIRQSAERAAVPPSSLTVCAESYERVPLYLRAARAGIAFIKPVPSKRGSSPTKIAEYLACGLPVIVNEGIGDLDSFVEPRGIGAALRSFDDREMERGVGFLEAAGSDAALRDRCVRVAAELFDLETVGVARYRALYRRLGVA